MKKKDFKGIRIRSISLFMAAFITANALPAGSIKTQAADADVAEVNSVMLANLADAFSAAGSGDTVYLLKDTELNAKITIDADIKLVSKQNEALDGKEVYTIQRAAGCSNEMFCINQDKSLEINDTVIDGGAVWEGTNAVLKRGTTNKGISSTAPMLITNGTLILQNGAVLQNGQNKSSNGGAIRVNKNGKADIYGAIQNNTGIRGGAVHIVGGILDLYDGASLSGNESNPLAGRF